MEEDRQWEILGGDRGILAEEARTNLMAVSPHCPVPIAHQIVAPSQTEEIAVATVVAAALLLLTKQVRL